MGGKKKKKIYGCLCDWNSIHIYSHDITPATMTSLLKRWHHSKGYCTSNYLLDLVASWQLPGSWTQRSWPRISPSCRPDPTHHVPRGATSDNVYSLTETSLWEHVSSTFEYDNNTKNLKQRNLITLNLRNPKIPNTLKLLKPQTP